MNQKVSYFNSFGHLDVDGPPILATTLCTKDVKYVKVPNLSTMCNYSMTLVVKFYVQFIQGEIGLELGKDEYPLKVVQVEHGVDIFQSP